MTRRGDSLLESALRLPAAERGELAARLIESLEPGDDEDDARAAWDAEIGRRLVDMEQGRVEPLSWDEARRRILDDPDAGEAG
jgi:putative addiction module component (TIGR02574 family)